MFREVERNQLFSSLETPVNIPPLLTEFSEDLRVSLSSFSRLGFHILNLKPEVEQSAASGAGVWCS